MGVLGVFPGTSPTTGYGRFEPKKSYQYEVKFAAMVPDSATALSTLLSIENSKSLTHAIKSIARPSADFSEIKLQHGNETWKIAGRTAWAPDSVEMTFYDVIPSSANIAGESNPAFHSSSAIFYEWQNLQQDITTGNAGLSSNYKSNVTLITYAPDGTVVETFIYNGAWPKTVARSGFDYATDESAMVTVTFSVDKVYRVATTDTTPSADSQANDGSVPNDEYTPPNG